MQRAVNQCAYVKEVQVKAGRAQSGKGAVAGAKALGKWKGWGLWFQKIEARGKGVYVAKRQRLYARTASFIIKRRRSQNVLLWCPEDRYRRSDINQHNRENEEVRRQGTNVLLPRPEDSMSRVGKCFEVQ